jgi:glucose-6-phosphate 1-dehydrogenase
MSPFVLVIYGATGDLAKNKLFPALFSLYKQKLLHEQFYIVGFARRPFSDDEFRNHVTEYIDKNDPSWSDFSKHIYYQQGLFDEKKGYEELIPRLNTFDEEVGACVTRLFYLATPPDNYDVILDNLTVSKLSEGCGQESNKWTKLVIEKPFGKDLNHARQLDKKLSQIFEEHQIFRVDHYLGKDTVQNIIAFRFANGIFDPVWNKNFIDHVQITMSEKNSISGRGRFFDGVGNLRDVGQNHLIQLIAAVAMEQPKTFSKEGVRDARAAAIKAMRHVDASQMAQHVVRGQYEGYTDEKDVAPDSRTETFVAMKFFVDTPRFEHIPFYVRAGKKMPQEVVEISIVFTQTCHILFKEYGCPEIGNVLTIRIQPDEGIKLRVIAKTPGTKLGLGTVDMKFTYQDEFGNPGIDAYEKVLLDIFAGDQMLFNRSDELEPSWQFIQEILAAWESDASPLPIYNAQEMGPKAAFDLIERDGKKWL